MIGLVRAQSQLWSHYFSPEPGIRIYLDYCADKYGIRRHIEFEMMETELRWIEQRNLRQVTTRSRSQERSIYARMIIAGFEPLSNAAFPTDNTVGDLATGSSSASVGKGSVSARFPCFKNYRARLKQQRQAAARLDAIHDLVESPLGSIDFPAHEGDQRIFSDSRHSRQHGR